MHTILYYIGFPPNTLLYRLAGIPPNTASAHEGRPFYIQGIKNTLNVVTFYLYTFCACTVIYIFPYLQVQLYMFIYIFPEPL